VRDHPDATVFLAAAADHGHLRRMYPQLHGLPEVPTSVDPDRRLVLGADGSLTGVRRDEA
jgi:hypothetical protein